MTPLAAYVLLFVAVGTGFIFVHLLAGKLIRPDRPSPEKGTIYECGEPTIGSAWIQFDLRFYVVALLFVIFDVEVAFFFPWAEVFGKANEVANERAPRSAKEYRRAAEKAFDLAEPGAADVDADAPSRAEDTSVVREARKWKALSQLTEEQYAAYRKLDEVDPERTVRMLRDLNPATYKALQQFGPKARADTRALARKYTQAVDELVRTQREAAGLLRAVEPLLVSAFNPFGAPAAAPGAPVQGGGPRAVVADVLPAGLRRQTEDRLTTEIRDRESVLRGGLLQDRRNDRVASMRLYSSLAAAERQQRERRAPGTGVVLNALARGQFRAYQAVVEEVEGGLLAALAPGAKEPPAGVQGDLRGVFVEHLARFTDEDYEAIQALPQGTLRALKDNPVAPAKAEARRLAWLALVEVLVFFGVLLVGFAYLWKRGDLAWVRSTAAERVEGPPRSASV